MEISQANIKTSSLDTKAKLTDDLFRLLQVRDKNKDMAQDWLLFLTSSKFNKLAPGEIYLAFQMALARELVDSKGNGFEMLPELSNNTTGKVLDAYLKYKHGDSVYQLAKDKLKALAMPMEPSEEQKQNIRLRFLQTVFSDVKASRYSSDAWLLYEELEPLLTISIPVKKRLFKIQSNKYHLELQAELETAGNKQYHLDLIKQFHEKLKNGSKPVVVQNRCKSIVVSNFIKKHPDFDSFKSLIENL